MFGPTNRPLAGAAWAGEDDEIVDCASDGTVVPSGPGCDVSYDLVAIRTDTVVKEAELMVAHNPGSSYSIKTLHDYAQHYEDLRAPITEPGVDGGGLMYTDVVVLWPSDLLMTEHERRANLRERQMRDERRDHGKSPIARSKRAKKHKEGHTPNGGGARGQGGGSPTSAGSASFESKSLKTMQSNAGALRAMAAAVSKVFATEGAGGASVGGASDGGSNEMREMSAAAHADAKEAKETARRAEANTAKLSSQMDSIMAMQQQLIQMHQASARAAAAPAAAPPTPQPPQGAQPGGPSSSTRHHARRRPSLGAIAEEGQA